VTITIGYRYMPVRPYSKQLKPCGGANAKVGNVLSWSGNSRVWTEHDKEKKRQKLLEYHQSPEGAATRSMSSDFMSRINKNRKDERNGTYILQDDDWMIDIPLDHEEQEDNTWL
jgi:hypothetical protein